MRAGVRARFLSQRQDLVDLGLALAVAGLAMVETATGGYGAHRGVVFVFDLAVTLPLALRRRAPLLSFALILAVILLQAVLLGEDEGAGVFFGLLLGAFSLGAHAPIGRAVVGLVAFVASMMIAGWQTTGDPFDDLAFIVTLVGGMWVAGRVVWSRNRLVDTLAAQSEELRLAREGEARALAAEHRARIARDVHDIVAHSVSLIVVQAEAGEAQLPAEAPAAECLRAIQRTGRATLSELRGVLGAMSGDRAEEGEPATRSPTPGLRNARRMATELGSAGLAVDLSVDGDVSGLPSGVDLAAYRILQEALTNSLRHAGASRVVARVSVTQGEVVIDVRDSGASGQEPAPVNGDGRGLVGMRERALAYGGVVEAGPTADGFHVLARIPVRTFDETAAP